jgi:hypothetical protein
MLIFDSSEGESGSSQSVGGSLGPVQSVVGGSPASVKPAARIIPISTPANTISPYRIPKSLLQQAMGAPGRVANSMKGVPDRVTARLLSNVPLTVIYPTVNAARDTGKRLLFFFSLELLSKILSKIRN